MVDVVHEPIDDEQAEMHIGPPADLCGFGLRHAVPIHPIFEPWPLNANVARWWSQFVTLASSRVHRRGSLWINVFKRSSSNPECLPKRGVSLMSK